MICFGSLLLTEFFTGEKKIHYRAQDSQFNARQAFFYPSSGVVLRIHFCADSDSSFHLDAVQDRTFHFYSGPDSDPFILKRIRIRILPIIRVMRICAHWPTDPLQLYFEPSKIQNFDFDADPDPAFDFGADPDPAFTLMLSLSGFLQCLFLKVRQTKMLDGAIATLLL
jgi:hypothetical protein